MSKQLQSNALPYVQAYIEKLAEYRLKPTELAVYLSLLSFTSKDDPTAFPSTKAIAERVHVGIRTVKQALDRLEEVDLITRQHRRRKDGTRTTTLYWVRAVFVADDPSFEPEADEQRAENDKVQNLHPAHNDKVQNLHLAHGKQGAESALHEPESLLTRTTTTVANATGTDANAPRTDTPPVSTSEPDTDTAADAVPDTPKPKRTRSGKKPPKPRNEYEQRDALYEAVEREVFGFGGQDTEPYHYSAPPGGITEWLRGRIAQYNKAPLVGAPEKEQQPEDVVAFVKWWRRTRKGADVPQNVEAFARHYRAFLTARPNRPAAFNATSDSAHDDMLDALLEDIG